MNGILNNRNGGYTTTKHRPDVVPPKTVHGLVQDNQGKAVIGAKVFVRDLKTNVTRTLITDKDGLYSIAGLPPDVDYEVYANFGSKDSDKKLVSSYLTRQDNLLNFALDTSFTGGANDGGPTFKTFDLVELHASLDVPSGIPAPIPAVLLLHGFGEDRSVWEPLKQRFLSSGWAVMAVDLRGHGQSTTQNQETIHPTPAWRTDSRQFPLDLEPAVNWLKSQPRLDGQKIVVIGSDIGADLALLASGRFSSVRTAVAINPRLNESLAMAGSAQDFAPKTVLIMSSGTTDIDGIKPYVKGQLSIRNFAVSGGTTSWLANKEAVDAIFSWIQQTY
jgi:pimeloyl-ACP methyl ester carboxylesterase